VVYLDAACVVVHVIEHLSPFRVAPVKIKAQTVLELPIRSVYSSRTQIGDRLLICSADSLRDRWQEQRVAIKP